MLTSKQIGLRLEAPARLWNLIRRWWRPTRVVRATVLLLTTGLVLAACGGAPPSGAGTAAPADGVVELSPSGDVERAQPDPAAPVEDLAAGFNNAGFDLLRTQPAGDNLVFSPVSVGHAL